MDVRRAGSTAVVQASLYEVLHSAQRAIAGTEPVVDPLALNGPETGRVDHRSLFRPPSKALATFLESTERAAKVRQPPQISGWNFDWDDNIFFMPTEIRVYHKQTGEEVGVSTADFALIREQIGKEGKWADYEMRPDSLRFFGDDPTGAHNHFAADVQRTISTRPPAMWKGPSWDAFVTACSRQETAKQTTIITARLHSPETIYAGLQLLQSLGYIKYLPPIENIYPVNYPPLQAELGGSANNPSAAKAVVMKRILDRIQDTRLLPNARKVLDPSGVGMRRMHLWGFSDDDFGNYSKAISALAEDVKKWPNVKITVFFTGKNHPTEKPRAEVIMPNGKTRLATDAELAEVKSVLRGFNRRADDTVRA